MNILRCIGEAMDRADERNIHALIVQKEEELADLRWQRQQIEIKNGRRAAKRWEKKNR